MVKESTLYVQRPQLSPFLVAYAEATYISQGDHQK